MIGACGPLFYALFQMSKDRATGPFLFSETSERRFWRCFPVVSLLRAWGAHVIIITEGKDRGQHTGGNR